MAQLLMKNRKVADVVAAGTDFPGENLAGQTIERLLSGAADEQILISFLFLRINDLRTLREKFSTRRVRKLVLELFSILLDKTPDDLYADCLGPNEFILLLPGVSKEKTAEAGEEIRRRFLAKAQKIINDSDVAIELQGSVVAFPGDGDTTAELLCQARDAFALASKDGGGFIQIVQPTRYQKYSMELPEIQICRMRRLANDLCVEEDRLIRQAIDEFLLKNEKSGS